MRDFFISAIGLADNLLFLIVFAVFGLIKYLSSLKKDTAESEPEVSDSDQAQRTREIQEEIRRRIAEGRNRNPQSAPEVPSRVEPVPRRPSPSVEQGRAIRSLRGSEAGSGGKNVLMQRLAEARRVTEESRLNAMKMLKAANIGNSEIPVPHVSSVTQKREGVLAMLGTSNGLRDAFIISEVISPPVSERENGACPGLFF